MNYKGKAPKVYDYYKNDRYISTGTMKQLSEQLGVSKQSLWCRHSRTQVAILDNKNFRVKHELIEVEDVNQYVMFIKEEFVAKGSIRELCEKTGYSKQYLGQIISGYYANQVKKKQKIEIFKKVG